MTAETHGSGSYGACTDAEAGAGARRCILGGGGCPREQALPTLGLGVGEEEARGWALGRGEVGHAGGDENPTRP